MLRPEPLLEMVVLVEAGVMTPTPMPLPAFPEMMLPAPGAPTTTLGAPTNRPNPFGIAAVPAAFSPMKLLSTTDPAALLVRTPLESCAASHTPLPELPEITFRAAAV